jgi:hypothetical protein
MRNDPKSLLCHKFRAHRFIAATPPWPATRHPPRPPSDAVAAASALSRPNVRTSPWVRFQIAFTHAVGSFCGLSNSRTDGHRRFQLRHLNRQVYLQGWLCSPSLALPQTQNPISGQAVAKKEIFKLFLGNFASTQPAVIQSITKWRTQ